MKYRSFVPSEALALTKDKQPGHPLYLHVCSERGLFVSTSAASCGC